MGCNKSRCCHQVCAQSINHHIIIPAPACVAPCGGLGLGYGDFGGHGGCGGCGGYGGYGGFGY
jgi:hypothetical protein